MVRRLVSSSGRLAEGMGLEPCSWITWLPTTEVIEWICACSGPLERLPASLFCASCNIVQSSQFGTGRSEVLRRAPERERAEWQQLMAAETNGSHCCENNQGCACSMRSATRRYVTLRKESERARGRLWVQASYHRRRGAGLRAAKRDSRTTRRLERTH